MSGASKHECRDRRDQELKCLCRMVRDLELEEQGRRRQRNREKHVKGSTSVRGSHGEASHQSSSHRSRNRSLEYVDRDLVSPEGRRP